MNKSEESKKIDNEQPVTYCGEKCEINNTEKQYLHEENLLSAPIAIETLDWEMVKQLNGILQTKRRASKTTVVDSDEAIDMDQLKKMCSTALARGKCHLLSRNCLEEIFQTHPDYIHEKDFVSLKRKRLKILIEVVTLYLFGCHTCDWPPSMASP
uniref:Uncharacterized protein n=1 Tax=Heterorhabditis bacteriophora TaxID=37862 RepID=A0A1I7XD36_HETBA